MNRTRTYLAIVAILASGRSLAQPTDIGFDFNRFKADGLSGAGVDDTVRPGDPFGLTLFVDERDDDPADKLDDEPAGGWSPSGQGTARVYWENDGFFIDPSDSYDRHYTNGFAIAFEHRPAWAEDLAPHMPLAEIFAANHGGPRTGAGYVLSQMIFTPADLGATAPVTTDQPYAGYLYGGVYWEREGDYHGRDDVAVLDHFELNVGVVGESALGEDVQEWVHTNFEGVQPNGWDNQLHDEVAVQVYLRRKWRVDLSGVDAPLLGALDLQVIPQVGLAIGTVYRYAEAAATIRIGQALPDDFGPGRINDLRSVTGNAFPRDGWFWYAFGRAGGRLVEHDTFLDGSNDSDPSPRVDREPVVGEVQGGLTIGYHFGAEDRFEFSWGVTYLTDQFDAPGDRGAESYGTWVLSWTRSF